MDLTDCFLTGLKKQEKLLHCITIVNQCIEGKKYLAGGIVYRTIIAEEYGIPQKEHDTDVIIEQPPAAITLPAGWTLTQNKYGNQKIISEQQNIDIMILSNHHSIMRRKLTPSITHYLTGVPFSIQSLVYDCDEQQLLGNAGIDSILTKTIRINNYEEAFYDAHLRNKTVIELLKEKAESVRFTPVYI